MKRKSNWAECPREKCGEEWWLFAGRTPVTTEGIDLTGLREGYPRRNDLPGCKLCRRALWRRLAVRVNWIGGRW